MEILIFSILALLVVTVLQVLVFLCFLNENRNSRVLNSAILLLLNINIFMQITAPIILGVIYGFPVEANFNISLFGLFQVIFWHFVYISFFLLVFLFGPKKNILSAIPARKPFSVFDKRFLPLLGIGIYLFFDKFSLATPQRLISGDNLDVSLENNPGRILVIYLGTMFEWSSLVVAFLYLSTKGVSRYFKLLIFFFIAGFVFLQLAQGLRGGIFIVIMLTIFISFVKDNRINFKYVVPLALILVPIFGFLGTSFREEIVRGSLVEADNFERLKRIGTELFSSGGKRHNSEDGFVKSLYMRLEAPRNSVCLINFFNDGNSAFLRPILSSLISFIPQSLSGVKNYAGSSTDDVFGSAMYVVRAKTYGTTDMGPYLASSHEYWEGGPLYLIFSSISLGLLYRGLIKFANSRSNDILSLLLLISFLDAHHGEMSVVSPLAFVIRLIFFQIVPLIIYFFFVSKIYFILRKQSLRIRI